MDRKNRLELLLGKNFNPIFMMVEDESYQHSAGKDAQTHYKITLVTEQFEGARLIKRHQQLNKLLASEFSSGMHAATMHLYTQQEWMEKQKKAPSSPKCRGGSKH